MEGAGGGGVIIEESMGGLRGCGKVRVLSFKCENARAKFSEGGEGRILKNGSSKHEIS